MTRPALAGRLPAATVTLALLAACACGGSSSDTPSPQPTSQPSAVVPVVTETAGTPESMRDLLAPKGGLTEAEFKALHVATPEKPAAAPTGTMIEVGGARAYLSLPPGATAPVPGIVVVHEWWGLNDNVKHWADRLAADGYAALAVDLYGGVVATDADTAMAAMNAVDDAKALAVMSAAHRFLKEDPRVMAPRTAVVGWCFGGSQALQLALNQKDLTTAVMYYGGNLVTDEKALGGIMASILAIFGTKDASIPAEAVAAFEAALSNSGVEHEVRRYDADHAFANPSGAKYDEAAAALAWTDTRGWLHEKLSE